MYDELNLKQYYKKDGKVFHKNNVANLITLCEDCHNEIHKNQKKPVRRVKTTKGYKILET